MGARFADVRVRVRSREVQGRMTRVFRVSSCSSIHGGVDVRVGCRKKAKSRVRRVASKRVSRAALATFVSSWLGSTGDWRSSNMSKLLMYHLPSMGRGG
jgi:hypothetical protein